MSLIQKNLVRNSCVLVKRTYWVPQEHSHLYDHHIKHNYVKQYDPPSKYGYYDTQPSTQIDIHPKYKYKSSHLLIMGSAYYTQNTMYFMGKHHDMWLKNSKDNLIKMCLARY